MAEYCSDYFKMVEDTDDSFRMWQGLLGPHYTPIMSNDGTLSWTNNGNLPNPDPVNLAGPQGAGIRIAGIVTTTDALPYSAPAGDIWLVGDASPYEGYSYVSGEWLDLGELTVGPAGPPGPQGDDYVLTEDDKLEIAGTAETLLLTLLGDNPLAITKGGTGASTLEDAKTNLGIDEIETKVGSTPLSTLAQDLSGAVNELAAEIGDCEFDTTAQNVTDAINELNGAIDGAVLKGTKTTISAAGTTSNISCPGLTADHVVVNWGMFSDSAMTTPIAQNGPNCDITITTMADNYDILVENFTSAFYIRPVFALPQN